MKDVITDLCERMDLLRLRYNIVFHPTVDAVAAPPYVPMAEALARGLADEDPSALKIVAALIDAADGDRAEFWASPLGRLVFIAGAKDKEPVTQSLAAAVLGCSRQWIHAMVTSGKLRSEEGLNPAARRVHAGDVSDLLKAKIDKEVNKM